MTYPITIDEIKAIAAKIIASDDAIHSVEIRTAWASQPTVWVDRDLNVWCHDPAA